jgi:hypothetical protein
MVMPPKVRSSSSHTPKIINPTASCCEFQTYESVVCKTKKVLAACMKESKKGKRGEEKQTTLGNPKVDASLDGQGVNIKVNM